MKKSMFDHHPCFIDFINQIDHIDVAKVIEHDDFEERLGRIHIQTSTHWDDCLKGCYRICGTANKLSERSHETINYLMGILSDHAHEIKIKLHKKA